MTSKNTSKKRKSQDQEFAEGFDEVHQVFKIGAVLRQARLDTGMPQEEVAQKLNTKKSASSRIENHADDIPSPPLEKLEINMP